MKLCATSSVKAAPWLFLAPFLLIFGAFTAWPLARSLILACQQTFGPTNTVFVGLDNFRFLLTDPLFWTALQNTFVYALSSVTLQLPLALGLALLLNRPSLRGRTLYRLIFFSPSLVGLVFAGIIFSIIFEKRTGLVNVGLHRLFPVFDLDFPWLQNYVMPALILASLWMYVGFNMIYFLAALQNVPRELEEAAMIDGANAWHRFRHIILPEIKPVTSFVVLLSLIGSFQLFELPWALLSGPGPENRGLTIVMYLYQTGFLTNDLGYASAIGWVLAVILFTLALTQQWFNRKETRS